MKSFCFLCFLSLVWIALQSCDKNDSYGIDPEHRLDELIDTDEKPDSNIDKRVPATIEKISMLMEDMGLANSILWLPGQYLVSKSKLYFDTTNSQYRFYIDELEIENRVPGYAYLIKNSKLIKISLRVQNIGTTDTVKLDGSYTSGNWCQLVIEDMKSGAKYLYEGRGLEAEYYSNQFDPVSKTFWFFIKAVVFDYNNLTMKTVGMMVFVRF